MYVINLSLFNSVSPFTNNHRFMLCYTFLSLISKIICILDTILISRVVCIFGHHPYYQRLFVFWTPSMLSRTVCIFGHQPYYEDYFCQYFWKPVSRAFQKCIICPFFAFFIIFTLFAK